MTTQHMNALTPEITYNCAHGRKPLRLLEYSLGGFRDLMQKLGLTVAQAHGHPEVLAYLRRREAVLKGEWPIQYYYEQDGYGWHSTQWTCPCCGETCDHHEAPGEDFAYTCGQDELVTAPVGCGARFAMLQVGTLWKLFLQPGTSHSEEYP